MAKNWAIAIGINNYEFLQPLRYAKRDAEAIRNFLVNQAGFDQVFFFTDDSPDVGGKSTKPFGSNIFRVLRQVFNSPFMADGDNFWFFFSGHGIRHQERDYLMPLDGDPEDVERTGIPTTYVTERLRRCGADNVVMILDACRSEGRKSDVGIGAETEAEARQTGVISLFSCSPEQYSYEIEAIQQGAFTAALLEGLGIRGRCATVERLNQYLETQVPAIVKQHLGRAVQVPYVIAEPISRSHLILMPQYAGLKDIAVLKNDAARAERRKQWDIAQQLWIRVLAAASGQDMDAIEALQQLAVKQSLETGTINPTVARTTKIPSQNTQKGQKKSEGISSLNIFINKQIINNRNLIKGIYLSWIKHLTHQSKDVIQRAFLLLTIILTSFLLTFYLSKMTEIRFNELNQGENWNTILITELNKGNLGNAQSFLEQIPQEKMDDPEFLFLQGRLIWQQLQTNNPEFKFHTVEDARSFWERAVTKDSKPLYYNALGFSLYVEGRLSDAVEAWSHALEELEKQDEVVLPIDSDNNESNVSPFITVPTENISNPDALTAYAGISLALAQLAVESPQVDQQVDSMSKVIKIIQIIRNSDPSMFETNNLRSNWLWTDSMITEWKHLSQVQFQ